MARTSTNKTKEINLPKYLKLAKGTMWMDHIGENASGVRLYNTGVQFVGRGCITDDAWDSYQRDGYLNNPEVPDDKNKNSSAEHGEYGYVNIDEDKSIFCTDDIPKSKLGNIITAYNAGVLIEFDPEKAAKEVEDKKIESKNFTYSKDGDIIFSGKNKRMFDKLNNSTHDELIKFIQTSPMNAKTNLMDLYDYEMQGFNRLSRPRASVLDALRNKLNSFGPGMSPITVERDEDTEK